MFVTILKFIYLFLLNRLISVYSSINDSYWINLLNCKIPFFTCSVSNVYILHLNELLLKASRLYVTGIDWRGNYNRLSDFFFVCSPRLRNWVILLKGPVCYLTHRTTRQRSFEIDTTRRTVEIPLVLSYRDVYLCHGTIS